MCVARAVSVVFNGGGGRAAGAEGMEEAAGETGGFVDFGSGEGVEEWGEGAVEETC